MTSIWASNIIIGNSPPLILKEVPIKKLPLHIILSDSNFKKYLKTRLTITEYKRIKKYQNTNMPKVNIVYLRFINYCNLEPDIL